MQSFKFPLFLFFASTLFLNYQEGPPAATTGSPGDAGRTCSQGGCHFDAPVTKLTKSWISTNIPANGFVPNTTYNITLTANGPGHSVFGFCATSQDLAGNPVGTIGISDSKATQFGYGDYKNSYITHTLASSTGKDSRAWQFSWKSPSTDDSTTFYASVLLANGNGDKDGDSVFVTKLSVFRAKNTAINDIKSKVSVQISPNPVSINGQNVIFQFDKPEIGSWYLRLYTAYGSLISSEIIQGTGNIQYKLPLSHCLSGNYLYNLSNEKSETKATGKIVLIE